MATSSAISRKRRRYPIAASGHATVPINEMNSAAFNDLVGAYAGILVLRLPQTDFPFPKTFVEGGRRAQGCPGGADTLGARKTKALHEVNQVVAQPSIRRHLVDRFYARHFDLRQARR